MGQRSRYHTLKQLLLLVASWMCCNQLLTLWERDDLWQLLLDGVSDDQRKLPSSPSAAAARLGLWAAARERMIEGGVNVTGIDSRYQRMLQGQVIANARSLIEQDVVIRDLLNGVEPQGAFTWVRNLRRCLATYEAEHSEASVSGLRDVIDLPQIAVKLPYQYGDKQIVDVNKSEGSGVARVNKDALAAGHYVARCKGLDGSWFTVTKQIPKHYAEDLSLELTTPPMLWVDAAGKLRMRVTSDAAEAVQRETKTIPLLHIDWNVTGSLATLTSSLLTSTIITNSKTQAAGSAAPSRSMVVDEMRYEYKPQYLLDKITRLYDERTAIDAKIKRIKDYYTGDEQALVGKAKRVELDRKLAALQRELLFVDKSRRDLNTEIATRFAHEALHIIQALRIKRVIVEDLASLEARRKKMSKEVRVLINQCPRGLMFERLEAVCRKAGVEFHRVNARYTSSRCPHCGSIITHPTYQQSYCAACDATGDRDDWASIRIGLKHVKRNKIARRRSRPRKAEIALQKSWLDCKRESAHSQVSPAHWSIVSQGNVNKPPIWHPRKNNYPRLRRASIQTLTTKKT